MDITETSAYLGQFMLRLATHIEPHFPHYAIALRGEIHGRKLTNDRWNRIAAILSSLSALPGTCFGMEEHEARNPALSAVVIAQKMASATFGGRNVDSYLDLAVYIADEITARIAQPEGT